MQIRANVKYHVTQLPFCSISSPLHDLHTNWGRTNWHDNSAAARPGWEEFSKWSPIWQILGFQSVYTLQRVPQVSVSDGTALCCAQLAACVARVVSTCPSRGWLTGPSLQGVDARAVRRLGNEARIRCDWAETHFLFRNTLYPFPQGCHHVVSQLTGWNWSQCLTL